MNSNFISVLMTTYNCAPYIEQAIRSILNQTHKDFEFLIIDDGSTDKTEEIMNQFNDTRIRYIKRNHFGRSAALNYGLKNASFNTIALMDADDIAEKNRFEVQLNALQKHPEFHVIGSNVTFINEYGKIICEKKYPEFHDEIEFMMPVQSAVCNPTAIIKREIFERVGYYKIEYKYAEDHELFLNLIYHGYKFYNVQDALLKYRIRFMKTDESKTKESNLISYKLGTNYLNRLNMESSQLGSRFSYYFRMGLIEYYRGSLSISRKYFIKAFVNSKHKMFKILRYYSVTLLGQKFIDILRQSSLLPKLSLYLNKITKIDLHRIR